MITSRQAGPQSWFHSNHLQMECCRIAVIGLSRLCCWLFMRGQASACRRTRLLASQVYEDDQKRPSIDNAQTIQRHVYQRKRLTYLLCRAENSDLISLTPYGRREASPSDWPYLHCPRRDCPGHCRYFLAAWHSSPQRKGASQRLAHRWLSRCSPRRSDRVYSIESRAAIVQIIAPDANGYDSSHFIGLTYLQGDYIVSRHFTLVGGSFLLPFNTYNERLVAGLDRQLSGWTADLEPRPEQRHWPRWHASRFGHLPAKILHRLRCLLFGP